MAWTLDNLPPVWTPGLTVEGYGYIGYTAEDSYRYLVWRNNIIFQLQNQPKPLPPSGTPAQCYYAKTEPQNEGITWWPIDFPRGNLPPGHYDINPALGCITRSGPPNCGPKDDTYSGTDIGCPPGDTSPTPDKKCCTEGELCDGMNSSLSTVADTLKKLAEAIEKRLDDADCASEKCKKQIEDTVDKKLKDELKKFAKCQQMAEAGLCGSVEFAMQCGTYAETLCKNECYQEGIGNVDGKCHTCGQEPCCCDNGKCVPCPEEEKQGKRYIGWCNDITGVVIVTGENRDSPGEGFRSVTIADTEHVAFEEATQYCKRQGYPSFPPTGPSDIPATAFTATCFIDGYRDGTNAAYLAELASQFNASAGAAEILTAMANIGLGEVNAGNAGKVIEGVLSAIFNVPPIMLSKSVRYISSLLGCHNDAVIGAATAYSTFGLFQKLTGFDLSQFTSPYTYSIHAGCRNKLLTPGDAMKAYLAHAIDRESLDTHWAVAGFCPEAVNYAEQSSIAKPVPFELSSMRLRKIISEAEYIEGMRQLGYTRTKDSENILALRQQLPTLSDIIHFMVRDADDEGLAKKFHMDDYFTDKYQKQLKEWSEQQGVPEKVARYAWRSHWQIPSPTQLFQFWRRLRKDNKFGGEAKLWDDIETALIQQDILPYWHEHYKAVNYQPLGRVDIRRAFQIGTIQESDLVGLFNQLGYSDESAEKLKKFSIRLRDQSIVSSKPVKLWTAGLLEYPSLLTRLQDLGYPPNAISNALELAEYQFATSSIATSFLHGLITKDAFVNELTGRGVSANGANNIANALAYKLSTHPSLREYIAGAIDQGQAKNAMTVAGMNQATVNTLINRADSEEKLSNLIMCQRGIKRRFLAGEFDGVTAENKLVEQGTIQAKAQNLVTAWKCELSSKGKAVNVNRLCAWLERGVINTVDFVDRAERMGYQRDDAIRIADDCLISINSRRLAREKKEAKEHAAEDNRIQRLLKQQGAEAARIQAQLERAATQRRKTVERRQKQLLSAVEKITKKCNCDMSQAMDAAKSNLSRIESSFALDKDEALQALITGVESWDGNDLVMLQASIDSSAQLIADTESSFATNGNGSASS